MTVGHNLGFDSVQGPKVAFMSRARVGLQGSFIVGGSNFLGNADTVSEINFGYDLVLHPLEIPILTSIPFGHLFSAVAFQIQL